MSQNQCASFQVKIIGWRIIGKNTNKTWAPFKKSNKQKKIGNSCLWHNKQSMVIFNYMNNFINFY